MSPQTLRPWTIGDAEFGFVVVGALIFLGTLFPFLTARFFALKYGCNSGFYYGLCGTLAALLSLTALSYWLFLTQETEFPSPYLEIYSEGMIAAIPTGIVGGVVFWLSELSVKVGIPVSAVLARIPLESEIGLAQAVMEKESFKCVAAYSAYAGEGGLPHPPANIVWCDSGELATFALLVTKRWQVIFVDKGGRVGEVVVSVGLTGL